MINGVRSMLRYFLHDMKLKYKFMITNMILVLVPTIVLFAFLYGPSRRL